MSNYKLTYFNIRARGETTRMLFELGGQKFEDVRIEIADWPKHKANTPFGQLPMLEADGQTFCQSKAIERLVAKRFGYYGDNELAQAKSDMVTDCLDDMSKPLGEIFSAKEEQKPELRKKYLEEKLPGCLSNLEKMVDSGGYFNGNKLSWPDLSLHNVMAFVADVGVDFTDEINKYPKLKALIENVKKNPTIAAWIEKRPKTPF